MRIVPIVLVRVVMTSLVALAMPSWGAAATAVEYYSLADDRYFMTADPIEIEILDTHKVDGWWRTGMTFHVEGDGSSQGTAPVCRFYSAQFGKPTHFYTASNAECARLMAVPDIVFEGIAFYVAVPGANGNCPEGTTPMWRLFSNTYDGSPSHVYTPYASRAQRYVDHGFTHEGTAFCVPWSGAEGSATKTAAIRDSRWQFVGYTYLGGGAWDFGFREVTLDFVGPMRSNALGPEASAAAQYLADMLPSYFYRKRDDGLEQVAGWDPLANQLRVMQAGIGDYNSTGDSIGVVYTMVVTAPTGDKAYTCARQTILNSGNQSYERLPALHPLQPLLVDTSRAEQCALAERQ